MASRTKLLAALQDYDERFPIEALTTRNVIDFVQAQPNCFERSLPVGHITGSAWLIDQAGKRALFTHHRKLDRWLQLGGHADGNSDVAAVAMNEAREESGLRSLTFVDTRIFDLDAHVIPARENEPEHIHYDVRYLIRCTTDESLRISDESKALAWFTPQQIQAKISEESILRMTEKWLARQ